MRNASPNASRRGTTARGCAKRRWHTRRRSAIATAVADLTEGQRWIARMAPVGSVHSQPQRAGSQALRQRARGRPFDGAEERARRVYAAHGRRQRMGRARRSTSLRAIRTPSRRCSIRPRTRSTGIRRFIRCRMKSITCDGDERDPLSASVAHVEYVLRIADSSLILGPSAVGVVRPRTGARRRHCADQRCARSDRPGAFALRACGGARGQRSR